MSTSVAERTSGRTLARRDPTRPGPHVVPGGRHGRQLILIGMPEAGDTEPQALDLPEHIAALERELRYYRRLIPLLTRANGRPSPPSGDHGRPQLDNLARWLTDGTRMLGSLSRSAAEQRQLELRLEAVECAHQHLRDEVAQLFADDPEDRAPWIRAGLAALIAVMVAIASVPFLMDWWQAVIPRHG